jgi:hypothetical protein
VIAKVFPFVKEKHRIRCFSFVIMEVRRTGAAGCPGGCGRPGKPGSGRRTRPQAPHRTVSNHHHKIGGRASQRVQVRRHG